MRKLCCCWNIGDLYFYFQWHGFVTWGLISAEVLVVARFILPQASKTSIDFLSATFKGGFPGGTKSDGGKTSLGNRVKWQGVTAAEVPADTQAFKKSLFWTGLGELSTGESGIPTLLKRIWDEGHQSTNQRMPGCSHWLALLPTHHLMEEARGLCCIVSRRPHYQIQYAH